MSRHAHRYPQVEPRAADLIDIRIVDCALGLSAADALALARRRSAQALFVSRAGGPRSAPRRPLAGGGGLVMVEHLERAVALGVPGLPAAALFTQVPAVAADAGEIAIRRRLVAGAPAVLVADGDRLLGAVGRAVVGADVVAGVSLARFLPTVVAPGVRDRLAAIGRAVEGTGGRAFLVGPTVGAAVRRQRGLGRASGPTEDRPEVVVEGGGEHLARAAAAKGPGPPPIDVLAARRRRSGGQTGPPLAAPIRDYLATRGLTVDAMAVELSSGAFGLIDPFGGREDIARGRLRVLHPLAFVEDPALAARAAAYARRRRWRLDAAARRARALARRVGENDGCPTGDEQRTMGEEG